MKIAVGKMGKSTKFNIKSWTGGGGDCEMPLLVEMLAKNNPNDTFYLIGKNDFEKLTPEWKAEHFPNNNIINVWSGLKNAYEESCETFIERIHEINFDSAIIMLGPHGSTNIPYFSLGKDLKKFLIPLDFIKNYVGPLYRFLNETTMPVTYILVDPRYKFRGRDLLISRYPKVVLSQYDTKYENKGLNEIGDAKKYKFKKVKYKTKYSGAETMFLYGKKKFSGDFEAAFKRKENVFRIVLNQGLGTAGIDRYPLLMKYIGKYGSDKCIEDIEIYGNWKEDIYKKDPRFKGPRKYEELAELMKTCKATLIIPIAKGWVTSKYIETMNGWDIEGKDLGMITFFSSDYDKQNHVLLSDHFLRVSPMNFRQKLAKVLTDDEYCKALYKEQLNILKPEYYTGEYFSNIIIEDVRQNARNN